MAMPSNTNSQQKQIQCCWYFTGPLSSSASNWM